MVTFAFYVNEFPSGGTGTAVQYTANAMIDAGHRVIVYTARHFAEQYPAGYVPRFEVVTLPSDNPNADETVGFLCRHLQAHRVAVLVVVAMHALRLQELKDATQTKMVYALHGVPFYEAYDVALQKRKAAEQPGRWGLWLSYWLLHHWRNKFLHSSRKKIQYIYRNIISAADRYVVLCDDYTRSLQQVLHLSAEDSRKLCVIPNGIMAREAPRMEKEKMILFVGRLTYDDKRPMRMVDIWGRIYQQLPDWHFVVVGDGPERQAMLEAVHRRGIERMDFPGFSNCTIDYYQRAAIVCLTSQYEGWPLCLAEGQTYGAVPIAFECSAGVRDIVAPSGVNGVLVKPFSCSAYAKKLLQLASDEQQLARLRTNVVEKSKTYAMARNSDGYRRLLEELV